MKRFFTLALVVMIAAMPLVAQHHNFGPTPGKRFDYSGSSSWIKNYYAKDIYFGIRLGLALSRVGESKNGIDYAASSRGGLHLGGVVGFQVTNRAPLFFETGLSYVSKGGEGGHVLKDKELKDVNEKFKTTLSYIQLPLTFKYIYYTDMGLSVHPLIGGYLGLGLGGNVRRYNSNDKSGAFKKDLEFGNDMHGFKRFDGGLRIGCGVGFSMFYFETYYDIGLANVGYDDYDSSRFGSWYLNLGVNF